MAPALVKVICDLGYEANLEHVPELTPPPGLGPRPTADLWKASYSIGAAVIFEGKSHLNEIVEAIEDVGYQAKLSEAVDLSKDTAQDSRRAAAIRTDGMYYFTIRAILSAISAADPAFSPTIYHPPTVEERARQMHARIRQRIFYRVLLSLLVAIPAFIIGIVFMALAPPTNPGRQYLMEQLRGVTRAEWALFIMATPVYFFAADIFHRRTIKELHSLWKPDSPVPILRRFYRFGSMDMLMSFGTTIAYFSSIVQLVIAANLPDMANLEGNTTYFDSVVFLTMFLLIGRLIEAYSKAKTGEAVTMLGKLRPKEALLVLPDDGHGGAGRSQSVPIDMLDFGDTVRVVQGGSPPWDGVLLQGEGEFDESSLNGESRFVKKTIGDPVYSGTINKGGPILIRTTGTSGDSMLDRIIKVVREGQARRAPIERVADALTSYFVPVVTLIAISTWLIWLSLGLSGTLPEEFLDVAAGGWPF
ncbi:Heavy metal translocatin [Coniochaeta hoffmannii]|uniref:Heavy metal translocatin n=1 Tax=Coniochaeta hoffmannii TaxID=91930 RepID=A0AA38REA5_9PEZI|nr:Heavy metal translocatin [Coniochaeta hoffmannii]